jgi:uncharacterized protein (TIGR03118 family)
MCRARRGARIECRPRSGAALVASGVLLALVAAACGNGGGGGSDGNTEGYRQLNLRCASAGACDRPNFGDGVRNAWGIAARGGVFAVSGNERQVTGCYDGEGAAAGGQATRSSVSSGCSDLLLIPIADPSSSGYASPTGLVWNDTTDFLIAQGARSASAALIVAAEEGVIAGVHRDVDDEFGIVAVDNSGTGARYTGLAIGTNGDGNFLYVANFRGGTVDAFDGSFAPATLRGGFTDPGIPAGFAPFGIQNLAGEIFVAYAKQDAGGEHAVAGAGNGYVSVFDTDGNLLRRFASQGPLDSPWGITRAPAAFGPFGGAIVIANHGDGRLNVFDARGALRGRLAQPSGKPITIEGLWGVAGVEPNGAIPAAVYFTAGPKRGEEGLFGRLEPTP